MSRIENERVLYAPLYLYEFSLKIPHKVAEAQALYCEYQTYDDIKRIEDRLRWCRMKRGLKQEDVADLIGVKRQVYQDWEIGGVSCIPRTYIDKLAEIFEISKDDLMDEYTKFIYDGQGTRLRNFRKGLGLNQKEYAKLLGIHESNYRKWENEKTMISRKSWERFFKNV